jgi:hypothetical protein
MCVDAKKLMAIVEGAEPFFKTNMFEVALNYGFTLMDCPAWSYVRSSERELLEWTSKVVVAAEKWTFILPPGKKFTVILNVTYSLEDCLDDVEKCLEYEFTKPLTYKVVAVMEETE